MARFRRLRVRLTIPRFHDKLPKSIPPSARSPFPLFESLRDVMTLPMPVWNDDWEKPDPLRGKRGWTSPDYFNLGIAAVLIVTALGLLPPAVAIVRETDRRARWMNMLREEEVSRHFLDLIR